MLAFFTPVSSSRVSTYTSANAARANIVENAKPYTKTVTLTYETNISPEVIKATEQSCHIHRSDNDTATSFNRMAQERGSNSSPKTAMPSSNDAKENVHRDNKKSKTGPSNGVTHLPTVFAVPKRSLFSSVLKRLSIQRSKTSESAKLAETKAVTNDLRKGFVDVHSKPRKFRRWLTQRIRKHKTKDDTDISEHSLASAEAVLETDGSTKQTSQLVDRSKRQTSVFTRQSHVRVSLVGPDLPRPCSSMEELNGPYPVKASDPRCAEIVTSAGESDEPLDSGHTVSTGRTLDHLPSTLGTSLSPSSIGPSKECNLARNHSLRFTEERARSRVHFSPLLINSSDVLHGNSFVSSMSEMQLAHPVASHKLSQLEDLRTSSPSYLRVAVAAFGYPTYPGDSTPLHSSIPAQRLRPMQLSLSSPQTTTVAFSSSDAPSHAAANLMSRSTAPSAHSTNRSLSSQSAHNSGATNFTSNLCYPSVPKGAVSNSTRHSARESSDSQHHKCSSTSPCPSPNANVQPTPNGPTLRGPRVRSHTAGTPDDHEHWQRSSLIMLAVTHASPRGRTAAMHESQQHSLIFDGIADPSPFNNCSSASDRSPTQVTKSPLNGGVETLGHDSCSTDANSAPDHYPTNVDGYHFLRQVDRTELELTSLIKQAENYLNNESMDEEASGLLRTAIGKGNLLIKDKFVQFRGLCHQNLDSRSESVPADSSTAKLTTEVKDLDGFWAMVMLQVTDMFKMFDRIAKLRENGWKMDVGPPADHVSVRSNNGMTTKHRKAAPSSVERPKANRSTCRRMAHERLETIKREMRAKKATMQGTESGDFVLFT